MIGLVPALGCWLLAVAPPSNRTLLLPLEHPGLNSDVVEALELGLRTEAARVLDEQVLLPRPVLSLDGLVLAAGCAELDDRCLETMAERGRARTVRIRLERRGNTDRFEVIMADRSGVTPYEVDVHPVDADSGPELRHHLGRALGANRPPPPSRLQVSPPLPAGSRLWLDGLPVEVSRFEDVGPGPHRVELELPARGKLVWTGRARPGRTINIEIEGLVVAPERVTTRVERLPPPGRSHTATWLLAGGAAATLGVAVPLLGVAVNDQQDEIGRLQIDCTAVPIPAPCQEGYDRATRTNLAVGVGVGLAVGALVAFVLEGGFDGRPKISLRPGPRGTTVTVGRAFEW